MQATLSLLQRLTGASGISGHEQPVRRIITDELSEVADPVVDGIGSVCFEIPGTAKSPNLLFVAHMDEIGFIVSDILDNGTLKMQTIGGWDPNSLQSSPVEITNTRGEKLFGVIGSTPVHYQKDAPAKMDIDSLFIDIGATSKEDVIKNFAIRLGSPITPVSHFHYVESNRRVFAKALDDRIGCCALVELGQKLNGHTLPGTIVLAGAVQEEVGTRGAAVLANYSRPDAAIILEGPPADDLIKPRPQGACGKGVQIRVYDPTMVTSPALLDFVISIAEKHEIKYQLTVRASGGTDAGRLHLAYKGVPAIVLGVPVRYAHSHNGCCDFADYEAMLKLCHELSFAFDAAVVERLHA
jgi:endoglucanase